jgi:hypothetical protein
MLDPLTSLSLAASLAELITFTHSAITAGRDICASGSTAEIRRLLAIAGTTRDACSLLRKQRVDEQGAGRGNLHQSHNEAVALGRSSSQHAIVEQASNLADDLIGSLTNLSLQDGQRKRKRDAIVPAAKVMLKMPKIREWHKQLQALQGSLAIHLAALR